LGEFERWESRYAGADYAFGKEPNYFLSSCKGLLPKSGRVLAVADGEGRNGVWLAEQGLDVLSIDFSPLSHNIPCQLNHHHRASGYSAGCRWAGPDRSRALP
jgi:hypothetical protein